MKKYLPIVALLFFGCSEKQTEIEAYSEPAYSKQYRDDSLTVIVSLSKTNITSSGKITAMVDVHVPDGIEPTVPSIGTFVDPFTVGDGYSEPIQSLPNGKKLHRRVWVLLPSLPGETVFQPLVISTGVESIKTDPISISVRSLLPEGTEELAIRDIAEPIELLPAQQKKRRSIYITIGIVLVLGMIPFIIFLLRKPKLEVIVFPHEAAFQSLENLPEDSLERIHELNHIFRSYHEARFRVPMVGKTAVELSVVLDDSDIISFLEKCDDIRFSNKVPPGFTMEAEQFVRSYIESTMETPE